MRPAMRDMLFRGDGLVVPHKPSADPPLHSLLPLPAALLEPACSWWTLGQRANHPCKDVTHIQTKYKREFVMLYKAKRETLFFVLK